MANDTTVGHESADGFDLGAIAAELGVNVKPEGGELRAEGQQQKPEGKADAKAEGATDEDKPGTEDEDEEKAEGGELKAEESESEAEDDEEAEAESEDGDDGKAEKPDHVQRRIDKLTAKAKTLEEKLEQAEAERAELRQKIEAKPVALTVDPENPLSSLTDAESLKAKQGQLEALLDWTDENRDGGSLKVGEEEQFFDADKVKMIRANAKAQLKAVPLQERYLAERAAILPAAKQAYPELFTEGSNEHRALQSVLNLYPWITRAPGWELLVGDAFVGMKLRTEKLQLQQRKQSEQKRTKGTAEAAKVPRSPAPAAQPKNVGDRAGAELAARRAKVFKSGGSTESLEEFAETLM
jgi:hypothetical protein